MILYQYWLHERVTWSTRENQCRPRRSRGWNCFSRGYTFPCYPFVQSTIIILYWMLIEYIVYITFCFKTIKVRLIYEFVFRTPWIQTVISRQSESMVNHTRINSAMSTYFFNITRRQAISPVSESSRVWAWFHDLSGDIDFYQMSLSQSELTILHESIIL